MSALIPKRASTLTVPVKGLVAVERDVSVNSAEINDVYAAGKISDRVGSTQLAFFGPIEAKGVTTRPTGQDICATTARGGRGNLDQLLSSGN